MRVTYWWFNSVDYQQSINPTIKFKFSFRLLEFVNSEIISDFQISFSQRGFQFGENWIMVASQNMLYFTVLLTCEVWHFCEDHQQIETKQHFQFGVFASNNVRVVKNKDSWSNQKWVRFQITNKQSHKSEIVIEPFEESSIGCASVDLTLSNEFRYFKPGLSVVLKMWII